MDLPTEQEFRDCGYTAKAANYPLSDAGFAWVCAYNGVKPEKAPRAWKYAPNQAMKNQIEAAAAV